MADVSGINPGDVVTFELVTDLIPDEFKNCKVIGIGGYDMAMLYEDVESIHANIFSTLPQGTPKNPRDYNYLLVSLLNEEKKAVGIPWIKDPITVVDQVTLRVTINDGNTNDLERVKRALNAYGFLDFDIEVIN